MDRVRFGRALGYGARHAAKSFQKAAEAATAPSPRATPPGNTASARPNPPRIAPTIIHARQRVTTTKTHAKTLGRSVWSPLAQFSSVLWLQVTGTFFTLLALFLSDGLWKTRSAAFLPIHTHAARMFYVQLLAFLAFAYFAVSNFVRAHLRGRRR